MKFTQLSATPGFPSGTAKIEQMGETAVTIALNQSAGATNQTITALTDSTLTNYLVVGTLRELPGDDTAAKYVSFRLNSTTSLIVRANRGPNQATLTAVNIPAPQAGDQYPTDTQIDPGTGHTHTGISTVGQASHNHAPASLTSNQAAITVHVDWMIVHK